MKIINYYWYFFHQKKSYFSPSPWYLLKNHYYFLNRNFSLYFESKPKLLCCMRKNIWTIQGALHHYNTFMPIITGLRNFR